MTDTSSSNTFVYPVSRLWELDLTNRVASSWPDGSSLHHFAVGESARVKCRMSNAWTDSVVLNVTYDPDAFRWQHPELPSGWTYRSNVSAGSLDITVVCPAGASHDTVFYLDFGTVLSKPLAELTVQPLTAYVNSLKLPCIAEKPQPRDTLIAEFDGCGSEMLLHYMQTGSIFEVLSVQPNPASDHLQLSLTKHLQGETHIELIDLLGTVRLKRTTTDPQVDFTIQSLPAGTYFVRVSQFGEVRTRRIVVQR